MDIQDFKNVDPQQVFSVRFGHVHDDGSTEWGDPKKVRFLTVQNHKEDGWYLQPMTSQGRPVGENFEGHTAENGILGSVDSNHVMQIMKLVEPSILESGYQNENLHEALQNAGLEVKNLSRLGRVFYQTFQEHREDTPDEVFEIMIDEIKNG